MNSPVRTLSIWALVLLAPYLVGFAVYALSGTICQDQTCGYNLTSGAFFLSSICFGPVALVGLFSGAMACVRGIIQASNGKQKRWLISLCATAIAIPVAVLAIVVLVTLDASANTSAAVQEVSLLFGMIVSIALLPYLALPMVITTLLYGIFAAPTLKLPGPGQWDSSAQSPNLRPAAMRDLTTFRLQVEAQLAAATRERLHLAFAEGAPVAARFDIDGGRRGAFVCERIGADSGVCVAWLVSFPDGQEASIDAREDTLLATIGAWRSSAV